LFEVRRVVASWLAHSVAVPIIIQVEISATDPVFVQIDAIRAPHEHESGAPRSAQPTL
jgi:hypothetical protein